MWTDKKVKEELKKLSKIIKKINELEEEYERDYREIKTNCKHTNTTYDIDPSGNHGGSTTCDLCGANISKKPYKDYWG